MTKPFDLGIFQDYLNTYGADLSRWPEKLRTKAEDYLKTSEDAQNLYIEALKLDKLLGAGKGQEPPEDLLNKILKNTEE